MRGLSLNKPSFLTHELVIIHFRNKRLNKYIFTPRRVVSFSMCAYLFPNGNISMFRIDARILRLLQIRAVGAVSAATAAPTAAATLAGAAPPGSACCRRLQRSSGRCTGLSIAGQVTAAHVCVLLCSQLFTQQCSWAVDSSVRVMAVCQISTGFARFCQILSTNCQRL